MSYPIVVGAGNLSQLGPLLLEQGIKPGSKVLLVTNPVVDLHYGTPCRASLAAAGFQVSSLVIEAGELAKQKGLGISAGTQRRHQDGQVPERQVPRENQEADARRGDGVPELGG